LAGGNEFAFGVRLDVALVAEILFAVLLCPACIGVFVGCFFLIPMGCFEISRGDFKTVQFGLRPSIALPLFSTKHFIVQFEQGVSMMLILDAGHDRKLRLKYPSLLTAGVKI
jgi:hypothetical protein